jgi:hypothetical protein
MPHGFSGALLVVTGLYFMVQSLYFGPNHPLGYDIHGPRPRWLFLFFLNAAFFNALGGILIKDKAPKLSRPPFLAAGAAQIALVWFAYRLSSEETREFNLLYSIIDKFCALLLLIILIGLPFGAALAAPLMVALPGAIGTLALGLTFFYPFQLAYYGNEWFACVLDTWPYQITAFANYIYIPTLFSFSLLIFGGTLYARKIFSPIIFAVSFFPLVLGTLVVTVLTQEVYITRVSTQRLIIFCPEDNEPSDSNDLVHRMAELLNTSELAIMILKYLNIPLKEPPSY